LYVLGLAAERAQVDLIYAMTMSNHEHLQAADRDGSRVVFYQYLHELVARAMNCLRGRFENFWAAWTSAGTATCGSRCSRVSPLTRSHR